jgi:hypothetical protein
VTTAQLTSAAVTTASSATRRVVPRRLTRFRILWPLRERDFALLWSGMTLSLIGDGVYMVAIAWQVYALSNAATALSVVGFAWMLPQLPMYLVAGVLADRIERRRVLIAADLARLLAVGAIGVLAVSGQLVLWHVVALVVLLGAADATFGPAFSAIVPELVPADLLPQANALDQFVRTTAVRLIGPALGGAVVASVGAGWGFVFDAGTFGASAFALSAVRARPSRGGKVALPEMMSDVREGFAYVRSQGWIWVTLVVAGFAMLALFGPLQVLLPLIVKDELGGSAADFGLILAAGGVGAIASTLAFGQRGLPRRPMRAMALAWAAGGLELACLGLISSVWQAALVVALGTALSVPGMIIWMTLLQTRVPPHLLGRVSSLDWLVSTSLLPVSFVLCGPLAAALGADMAVIVAGSCAAAVTLLLLVLPGVRTADGGAPARRARRPLRAAAPAIAREVGEVDVHVGTALEKERGVSRAPDRVGPVALGGLQSQITVLEQPRDVVEVA